MINVKNLINLISFFSYLIPITLLTGPFLPDLFVSLIAITFIFMFFNLRETKYMKNNIFYFLIIFYFYCIASSLLSDNIYFSLKSSFFYFRFIIFSIAIWYIIENNKKFLDYFLYTLIITFIIGLITGFYQYIFQETILGRELVSNRLYLLFSDNLILGQLLGRLFPLLVALIMVRKVFTFKAYILLFTLFITTDILVYLSGERTALGLIFLSSFLMLLFINKLRTFRIVTLIASIFIIVAISFLNPSIKERNIDHTINQLGLSNSDGKIYLFSPQHEDLFKTSINMYLKNPMFGIGPNNYRKECIKTIYNDGIDSCNTHPHNTYFQVGAELGIIGIFFLIIALLYFVRILFVNFLPKIRHNGNSSISNYQLCLAICFICSLWPILPTLNFFNNYINVIYYLPLGFYMHSIYSNTNK